MPGIVSGNLSNEITGLVVSSSDSKGLLFEYVTELYDQVPDLTTSLSTVKNFTSNAIGGIPSPRDCVEYFFPIKEKMDDVGFLLKIPQWSIGNFSETGELVCKTTKTVTGAGTGYLSLRLIKRAVNSGDKVCMTLSCISLIFDIAKVGSNVLPYNYNVSKYDALNVLIKGAAYACLELKLCDKAKEIISNVNEGKLKKFWSNRPKKSWRTIK